MMGQIAFSREAKYLLTEPLGHCFSVDLTSIERQSEEKEMESKQRINLLSTLFRENIKHFDDFLWKSNQRDNMAPFSRGPR